MLMKPDLSLLLLTHNDSQNIKQNFNWLDKCPNINEIIAIDDKSTDDTTTQLKKLASKHRQVNIFSCKLDSDFGKQRQFALSKTTNNWILWLDPDETPNSQLTKFLANIRVGDYSAFHVPRKTQFLGSSLCHGETGNVKIIRVFDKNKGTFFGKVHEIWQTSGSVTTTPGAIIHHSPANFSQFLEKINCFLNHTENFT